jgi:hypothetical protein
MTNAEYLEKYNSYINIALSYDGQILNTAVVEYTRNKMFPGTAAGTQTPAENATVRVAAKELCLATVFI